MITNLSISKKIWFFLAFLALITATIGIIDLNLYEKLVSAEYLPGVISQDLITIVISVIIMILSIKIKNHDSKKQLVILGLIGYLFYAYGMYVIERFYNPLYFIYMIIFGVSFYSIIFNLNNINQKDSREIQIPERTRKYSIGLLLVIPTIIYPLWTSMLIPLVQTGEKIEFLYSIFILDLCFIMPMFLIIAFKTFKKESFGFLLSPSLFILGFTILLPVAFGEVIKLIMNTSIDFEGGIFFLVLSTIFLIFSIYYLREMKILGLKSEKTTELD
jgi:hypothetical protein